MHQIMPAQGIGDQKTIRHKIMMLDIINAKKTFKCKETKKIFAQIWSKKFPSIIQRQAMKKLWMLYAAPTFDVLSTAIEQLREIKW